MSTYKDELALKLTRMFQKLGTSSKPKRKRKPSRRPVKITVTENPLQLTFKL